MFGASNVSCRIRPTYDRSTSYFRASSAMELASPVSSISHQRRASLPLEATGQGNDERPLWANVGRCVGVGREDDLLTAAADFELHGHLNVDGLAAGVCGAFLAVVQFCHEGSQAVGAQANQQAVGADAGLLDEQLDHPLLLARVRRQTGRQDNRGIVYLIIDGPGGAKWCSCTGGREVRVASCGLTGGG